jgi:hypothetical protein
MTFLTGDFYCLMRQGIYPAEYDSWDTGTKV